MPTLLEIERAVYRNLVDPEDNVVARHIVADGLEPKARLNVYRNTIVGSLTTALRLSYPAVHQLVGVAFFESAVRIFIEAELPKSANLDDYGAEFPEFLAQFQPAASLAYLPSVARLEWAVSRAIHASDLAAIDPSCLNAIDPADHGRIVFAPHPSLSLIQTTFPVDAIWRAVLAQDDPALAAIDLGAGAVRLIVQRKETGIDITRVSEPAWRFTAQLCAAQPLQTVIDSNPDVDAASLLADHLVAGRFVGFTFINQNNVMRPQEIPA